MFIYETEISQRDYKDGNIWYGNFPVDFRFVRYYQLVRDAVDEYIRGRHEDHHGKYDPKRNRTATEYSRESDD